MRDSVVLELDRSSFDEVARKMPAIYQPLLRALARRLADSSARVASRAAQRGGAHHCRHRRRNGADPADFYDRLDNVVGRRGKGRLLNRHYLERHFPGQSPDDPTVSDWLNAIEHEYELIAFLADDTLTDWTRKAIRQADQVLIVVSGVASKGLNPVEAFAFATHPPARRRLVSLHQRRTGWVEGTAAWLAEREVAMHHHVSIEDDLDVKSLHRFLTGRAVGYVAAGGGGFGPAHVGVFKAFAERGARFDMLGGASVGAAVLGGFAIGLSPEEVDIGTHDVFVTSRGFKRYTLPRYALLDHVPFDAGAAAAIQGRLHRGRLAALFRGCDGSRRLRAGALSHPSRPVVEGGAGLGLAPGGAAAGLHRRRTHAGRRRRGRQHPAAVDEDAQGRTEPGRAFRHARHAAALRGRLHQHPRALAAARQMLTPSGRRKLPALPNPIGVLQRCLGMHQSLDLLPLGPLDLVLTVPAFAGANFMDFDRHFEVFEAAYQWCRDQIDALTDQGDPALAAILATKD